MNNLSSYFGLVDAKIRASDKDLPVPMYEYSVAKRVTAIVKIALASSNF